MTGGLVRSNEQINFGYRKVGFRPTSLESATDPWYGKQADGALTSILILKEGNMAQQIDESKLQDLAGKVIGDVAVALSLFMA